MNPYEILGVAYNATKIEIKKAWRGKVKRWHPDVCEDKIVAEERVKEINQAYELLLSGKFKFSTQEKPKEQPAKPKQKPLSNAIRIFAYKTTIARYDMVYKYWYNVVEWQADLWISPELARKGGKLPLMVKKFAGHFPFTFFFLVPEQEYYYNKMTSGINSNQMTVHFNNIPESLTIHVHVMDI